MSKKISMSIEEVLKRVKNGFYKKAVLDASINIKTKVNKTDLVYCKGIPSNISYIRIGNN
jgi:hypothetical protein